MPFIFFKWQYQHNLFDFIVFTKSSSLIYKPSVLTVFTCFNCCFLYFYLFSYAAWWFSTCRILYHICLYYLCHFNLPSFKSISITLNLRFPILFWFSSEVQVFLDAASIHSYHSMLKTVECLPKLDEEYQYCAHNIFQLFGSYYIWLLSMTFLVWTHIDILLL